MKVNNYFKRFMSMLLSMALFISFFGGNYKINAEEDPFVTVQSDLTNVALNKSVIGSANEAAYPVGNIVDGDKTNFGHAGQIPGWFVVDLGTGYNISEIVSYPLVWAEDNRSYQYEISASLDGVNFEKVAEKKDDVPSKAEGFSHVFNEVINARYIKVEVTGCSANDIALYSEIEVFGEEDPNYVPPTEPVIQNVAFHKPVKGNAELELYPLSNIVDGNNNNFGSTGVFPGWFEVDLEDEYVVSKIVARPLKWEDNRYYHYKISSSVDGVTYTTLVEKTDNTPTPEEGFVYEFDEPINTRYIKVDVSFNSHNDSVHFSELEVYGVEAPEVVLENVALNKSVIGSANEAAYPVGNIVDGDKTNFGHAGQIPGWFVVDLGTGYNISEIVSYPLVWAEDNRNYQYVISASLDGVTYEKVAEKTDDVPSRAEGFSHVFNEVINARYIKVEVTGCSANDIALYSEIEVFGEEDPNYVPPTEPVIQNVAFNKPVTGNGELELYPLSNIVDGNNNNFGSTGLWPGWFEVDLEGGYIISKIVARPLKWEDNRYYHYKISSSLDGVNYTTVAEKTDNTPSTTEGFTYEFDEPINARFIKVDVTFNSHNEAVHFSELEVYGYEDPNYVPIEIVRPKNVALNKPITGNGEMSLFPLSSIVDGDISNYGSTGVYPGWFEVDLGSGHFISEIIAYPLKWEDNRYYHYEIYGSLDGYSYTKIAEKTDSITATTEGFSYKFDEPVNARYIRVDVTYNSHNDYVHFSELKVMGVEDPNYVPLEGENLDPNNVAYNKSVQSNAAGSAFENVNDGKLSTSWTADFFPAYVEVDLSEEYDLTEVILNFPVVKEMYYYYTVYGSNDGSNYDRLYQKRSDDIATVNGDVITLTDKTYRFVRVNIEYCSDSTGAMLSEIRVHGTPTGNNTGNLRTGSIEEILGIKPFNETEYAAPITEQETIENVYGIIDRTVGSEYRSWFTFEIVENSVNEHDYYEITDSPDGKILIRGNEGLSLSTGLNYYYKNYCNVNISEQANQTKMPDAIVPINGTVRRESKYEIRYAFNYCTSSYTFAYFDAEDYQKENDWLALNGVNLVLDLAGQEAVWTKFLMNFGYSYDEAKNWLVGPSYYAFQFMCLMESYGGSVSDGWIEDRLEIGRSTQRWKNSLGMETVLQGYSGMVPTNFTDYQNIEVIDQGKWCGYDRPPMIRTDGELYDEYAELFYKCQEWAFGTNSNYYAVDPFHEGGIRPTDLSDTTIATEVLNSLLEYDEDAIWTIQAWYGNPTQEFLNGLYDKDHALIIDIDARFWNSTTYGEGFGNGTPLNNDEFDNTNWVWSKINNFGGCTSMHGDLEAVIQELAKVKENADYLKGIGIASEATYDNPVYYELIFDMAWEDEEIDLDEFLDDYVVRRYGQYSESARKAWTKLTKSVYGSTGNTSVLTSMPDDMYVRSLPYAGINLVEAFELLLEDYDKLSSSEAYLYDLTDVMRTIVSNYAVMKNNDICAAYNDGDLEAFKEAKEQFLKAFDLIDLVQGTRQDQLVGEWIGKAEDWAEKYDDYTYDTFTVNAKANITTWGSLSGLEILDYSQRQFQGILIDLYKTRYENFLDKEEAYLENGTPVQKLSKRDYFHFYWEWVMDTPEYTREANNSEDYIWELAQRVLTECEVEYSADANEGNLALNKPVSANGHSFTAGNINGMDMCVNDGDGSTFWDFDGWSASPWIIIDLEDTYNLDKINVLPYYLDTRYYFYDIYVSENGEDWNLVAEKTSTTPETEKGTDFQLDGVSARYIKLVGVYNSKNSAFHICEIRAYEKINTAHLEELISEVESMDLSVYTSESVDVLNEKLNSVKELLTDSDVTQKDLDKALEELNSIKQSLVYKDADYTAVYDAIDMIPLDLTIYTSESVKKLSEAAAAIKENLDITKQEEVDAMAEALLEAIEGLELKPVYTITEGANSVYTVNQGEDHAFKCDGPFEKFVELNLYCGEEEITVGQDDVTISKGSTIVTFTKEFLNSLKEGEYRLVLTYEEDITSECRFRIKKAVVIAPEEVPTTPAAPSAPSTGDSSNILGYGLLALMSLLGLVGLKKRRFANK